MFLVFERFIEAVAAKIIEYLERQTERVHMLMRMVQAFGFLRNGFTPFAKGLVASLSTVIGTSGTRPASRTSDPKLDWGELKLTKSNKPINGCVTRTR